MGEKDQPTREKILRAAWQLMDKGESIQSLSVRRIAKRAGISFSTINYYFGSKDNLITESLITNMNKATHRWIKIAPTLEVDAVGKLKVLLKLKGDYYARHPNLIKISIISSPYQLQHFREQSSTLYYFIDFALMPLLREICPVKTDVEIRRAVELVYMSFDIAYLQFLHAPERSTVNFFDKQERDAYMEQFTDILLHALQS